MSKIPGYTIVLVPVHKNKETSPDCVFYNVVDQVLLRSCV